MKRIDTYTSLHICGNFKYEKPGQLASLDVLHAVAQTVTQQGISEHHSATRCATPIATHTEGFLNRELGTRQPKRSRKQQRKYPDINPPTSPSRLHLQFNLIPNPPIHRYTVLLRLITTHTMSDDIRKAGMKGWIFAGFFIFLILFLSLCVYIYRYNMNGLG